MFLLPLQVNHEIYMFFLDRGYVELGMVWKLSYPAMAFQVVWSLDRLEVMKLAFPFVLIAAFGDLLVGLFYSTPSRMCSRADHSKLGINSDELNLNSVFHIFSYIISLCCGFDDQSSVTSCFFSLWRPSCRISKGNRWLCTLCAFGSSTLWSCCPMWLPMRLGPRAEKTGFLLKMRPTTQS